MAVSLAGKANRRATLMQAAIRDLLAAGNSTQAYHAAIRLLQGEAAKVRRRRPGDGALIDAELAASLSQLAAQLHAHKPRRPSGCPAMPEPAHLLAAFDATIAHAAGEDPSC